MTLAQRALEIANDPAMSAAVRLSAMKEFRAAVGSLRLPAEEAHDGDAEATNFAVPYPRKVG